MIRESHTFQPFSDEPISLLSESGEWLADFELDLDDARLLDFYRQMVLARITDERVSTLQRQGKVSFVAPSAGHEGAQVGLGYAIRPGHDWVYPYYRDVGFLFVLGMEPFEFIAQAMGTRADTTRGRQMPYHTASRSLRLYSISSPIASHIPPAVGTALSMKLRGTDEVTVVNFGDGATSEGDWHAAINLAGAQGVPCVFVCQNNRYAISVGLEKQTGSENIAIKAHAYGMPGYIVDGMDALACYYVSKFAIQKARDGFGPSLIEMQVYRYGGHSSADDDSRYRPRQEVEAWKRRDPLIRMRKLLERRKLWSQEQDDELRARVNQELTDVIARVEAAGSVPVEWMFDDVYAELPDHLREQREDLLA